MDDLLKEKIKFNFDRSYKTYDQYCGVQNKVCQKSIDLLLRHACHFDSISDFACGTGESTRQLIERVDYNKCCAVDFSEKLLSIAKNKLPADVKIILSDFDEPVFNKEFLDLVFCNMGLQWSLSLENAIWLFNQYLRKNGILAFSMPIENNFPEIKREFKLEMIAHERIEALLKQSGFLLIEYVHQHYTEVFPSIYHALRAIKKIGANCPNHSYNYKRRNVGLSTSNIKKIFINPEVATLTYQVGIYLAKKR